MHEKLRPILHKILEDYALPVNGYHGVAHWARVLENGLRLSAETGADVEVVSLFAILHDSRRLNEGWDPDHGPRAALFAEKILGTVFEMDPERFFLLQEACIGHTHEKTHQNVTIQTCFDADRLDLGRVGIRPDPRLLSTAAARSKAIINWADGRASFGVVPEFVKDAWDIEL